MVRQACLPTSRQQYHFRVYWFFQSFLNHEDTKTRSITKLFGNLFLVP
jgi:hypothetical protein